MGILYAKAFHIVGFVAWFAGLFYWLRIFVYLAEASQREEPAREILLEQFTRMEKRVYSIIVIPGAVITWFCGILMLIQNPGYISLPWLQVKLVLLVLLVGFQAFAKTYIRRIEENPSQVKPERLRLMNEVPTVFLLAIVLLAVLRNNLDALAAFGILVTFMIGLALGVHYYKGYRARNPEH
jgi:putative membrane protein